MDQKSERTAATRREAMLLLTAAGAMGAAGCASTSAEAVTPLPKPIAGALPMIDGHCHTFNAKDISPTRFIRYAFLEHYPGPEELALVSGGPETPDLLDGIIATAMVLVGATRAPSVEKEIAHLDKGSGGGDAAKADDVATAERLATFLGRTPRVRSDDVGADYRARGEAYVYQEVMEQGGGRALVSGKRPDAGDRRAIADAFLSGAGADRVSVAGRKLNLLQLFKWLGLFSAYRSTLVDKLARRHLQAGWEPVMMVPAMVDFARFVREEPAMPLQEQVRVWDRIARRPDGPAVHGYVAFCPLRQAEWTHAPARWRIGPEPLKLVEDALTLHGFLGVKLYPPMGFQAQGNAKRDFGRYPFSTDVLQDRFGPVSKDEALARNQQLGGEIDEALTGLYALCERLDAPIMAHGGPGNAVKRYYGELSDPSLWRPLFGPRSVRPLRIMLAHYGAFKDTTIDPAWKDAPWPANTKEAVIARYLQTARDAPVVVDMSMFTEAITLQGADRDRVITAFGRFMRTVGEDHMVFGTDWTMLGLQKGEEAYDARMLLFLRDAGLDPDRIDKVLRRNFVRFAGLEPGQPSRQRLDAFNASYGQPNRLARLDA